MKQIKILDKTEGQSIDWSKPMWVKNKTLGNCIILTTGKHSGEEFTGTALPYSYAPDGFYSENWRKEAFTPLTGPITIEISN